MSTSFFLFQISESKPQPPRLLFYNTGYLLPSSSPIQSMIEHAVRLVPRMSAHHVIFLPHLG